MVTIDGKEKGDDNRYNVRKIKGIEYHVGWSITIDDIPKVGDPFFIDHPQWGKDNKFTSADIGGKIAHRQIIKLEGETDLIRKVINESGIPLDFFFCDTGEYCGFAEWNIVKDIIIVGGYYAAHDIYYPKSIKNFRTFKEIKKSKNWEILLKTKTPQGMMVARKIN